MKLFSKLALAASLLGTAATAHADEANYIFYFIGDGMGPGAVMVTQNYLRTTTERPDTALLMTTFPVASLCTTYSASSPVTDSAAAGTALATGTKTRNGMLGMAPDTTEVTSIARRLQTKGYGIGLVTTVAADDATPAAFYAHVPSRGMYHEIGRQAAASGYDFIGGAGLRGFSDKNGLPTGLASEFDRYNYTTVRGTSGLDKTDAKKILMLGTDTIHPNHLGYSIEASKNSFDITDMTRAAIAHLQKNKPATFFLMVEGGAIDHGGHANDAGTVIHDTMKFDEALREAYNFYLAHPTETLIIVTADHETGGMSLGNIPMGYMANTSLIEAQKMSKDSFSDMCKNMIFTDNIPSWEEMQQILADNFGFGGPVQLTESELAELQQSYTDTFVNRSAEQIQALYNQYCPFAADVLNILDRHTGIGWTSIHHTGNPVPVFAIGVGAEKFSSMQDNVKIPTTIMEIVETYNNPPAIMR